MIELEILATLHFAMFDSLSMDPNLTRIADALGSFNTTKSVRCFVPRLSHPMSFDRCVEMLAARFFDYNTKLQLPVHSRHLH